jgi:hypothetical protein
LPPDAVVVFVTLGTAVERTCTLIVIGLPVPPAAMTLLLVHVIV